MAFWSTRCSDEHSGSSSLRLKPCSYNDWEASFWQHLSYVLPFFFFFFFPLSPLCSQEPGNKALFVQRSGSCIFLTEEAALLWFTFQPIYSSLWCIMKIHSVINYFLCLDLKSEGNSLPFKSFLHSTDRRVDIQIFLVNE